MTKEEKTFIKAMKIHCKLQIVFEGGKWPRRNDKLIDVLFGTSVYKDKIWQSIRFPKQIKEEYETMFWSIAHKRYLIQSIREAYWDRLEYPRQDIGKHFFNDVPRTGHDPKSFKLTIQYLTKSVKAF